jgi:glucose-1-phosphate cytidylyltransferase
VSEVGSVVILCGGRGTRLQEHTHSIPKALVEIGGKPILWHVIRIYAAQGLDHFTLCTGYLGEMIRDYIASEAWPEDVEVDCVDTGLDTQTGGRIKLVADRVAERTFCATYADGVANIDLRALIEFHRAHGDLATVTVVKPRGQVGVAELDGADRVTAFREKPRLEQWINGGFFCFEPGVVEYLDESSVLEDEPLERLAAEGGLRAYRHHGFWDCMDTYKDAVMLNDLWKSGDAPWRVWADPNEADKTDSGDADEEPAGAALGEAEGGADDGR